MNKEDKTPDNFDQLYEKLKEKVKENGYQDMVTVEKGSDFVRLQFKDSVLFYPDSAQMVNANANVLKSTGDIIKSIDFFLDKGEDEVLRLKFENPEYYLFGEYSLEIR
jgi:flagellar motor protein MotB